MKEYMMIFRNEKNESGEAPSAEQMQAVMKQWQTWIKGIAAAGKYIHCPGDGAAELQHNSVPVQKWNFAAARVDRCRTGVVDCPIELSGGGV